MARHKMMFVVTVVIMLILVTACNGGEGASSGNGNSKKEERPTISFMSILQTAETPDPKLEKALEEKLNVNLEIQWIPAATYVDRLNSAFATGNLTDVSSISLDGPIKEAVRDDQFWEIGPYLDRFENLSKLKPEIMNNVKVDGKIYALYQGRPLSRQGIVYRKDWADHLGLAAPTNTDELLNMLKQFTENDPDGNGVNDTIGLADRDDLTFGAFKTVASWFGAPNEWGFQNDKLAPAFMLPEYKQAMNYMKELRDKGYMNKDFPVTSKVDQQNMVANGTAGVYIGCMCNVQQLHTDAVQLNPKAEFDVFNQIKGPNGEYTVWAINGYNYSYLFPKSAIESEEELLQVLTFMDQLMSEEISNLLIWGIEGEHYNVVDGAAIPIEDQSKIDREVYPYMFFEIGEPETNGRLLGNSSYEPANKAAELFEDNDKYVVSDPTITLDSDTLSLNKDRLKQIMNDATFNYILGELDEAGFQAEINRWRSEGGDQVIEELNASYEQNAN
ncbi:extracellular solute-binding protein [Paenibacillus sp. ACRRY]|uniref:extracellular solute-binding protein n=1 Tax=Paenibacillus sp. ACRRY TaxID=2918208 RepID=UPI001EF61B18|nr:extracellular solute-binding protein [Paenibacillus sp. ACRRY]MCG7381210.1 extracellular solute-binding protein [Paenibacillus sp. ACRRY]